MKNKKSGFTLIELILAITIGVILLGIMLTIFILSTKIFTNVNTKSTLQTEAQSASDKINIIGMQASGIDEIVLSNRENLSEYEITDKNIEYTDLEDWFTDSDGVKIIDINKDDEKYLNIKQITIKTREEVDGEEVSYIIRYEPNADSDKTKPRGALTIQKQYDETKQVIGEDVESITIKPQNTLGKLLETDSIQFNINFSKKRGFSDIKYSIPINVFFRNKIV